MFFPKSVLMHYFDGGPFLMILKRAVTILSSMEHRRRALQIEFAL